MVHNNFIAYFWKWGDFLKSCWAKNDLVSKLHFFTIEPYKGQSPTSSCANCIIFLNPWFKYINLSHIFSYTNHKSDKFQSFHAQSTWRYNSQLGPDHMGKWSYKAMCMNSVSCPTVLFFTCLIHRATRQVWLLGKFPPGIALTWGLARLSYNHKVDFCCV